MLPHGIHANIPAADYHVRELGMASKSALDEMHRSPLHYKAWVDGAEKEQTPALLFGAAFHASVLEPEVFASTHVVQPEFGDCRFKENKAARDNWRAGNAGKTIVSGADWRAIRAMTEAVYAHPLAGRALREGDAELTARWRDTRTGLEGKCRADFYVRGRRMLVDLKSTDDASPAGFRKAIANYGYHRQDAYYREGFTTCGAEVKHFLFVACEKVPPYAVAVHAVDEDAVMRGRLSVHADMERLAECLRTGEFPGYEPIIHTLSVPDWAA